MEDRNKTLIASEIKSMINDHVIFIKFEAKLGVHRALVADYFGHKITIYRLTGNSNWFVCTTAKYDINADKQVSTQLLTAGSKAIHKSVSETIRVINRFIKSHPFRIVKHGLGKYQLLDPDGYDYIGEYVTMRDAANTCQGNFR